MTIGQNEDIFVGGVHIERRIVFHDAEIQSGKIIGTTQRTARMSAVDGMYHTNDISAELGGDGTKVGSRSGHGSVFYKCAPFF